MDVTVKAVEVTAKMQPVRTISGPSLGRIPANSNRFLNPERRSVSPRPRPHGSERAPSPGPSLPPSPEADAVLSSPSISKRFKLTGEIVYKGLASTVFLGIERLSALQVVVKVLLKAGFSSSEEQQNAEREIQIHTNIAQHKNIVYLLATEETDTAMLLVMPYTPHRDLWELVKFSKTYCEREVRKCAAQMLVALRHVHNAGIAHCDVKPHNFLLFRSHGVYTAELCDFGLACECTATERIPYTGLRGTSGWYSPEILAGREYGQKVDVFGVGLIIFRMLGGYEPFMPPSGITEVEFDDSCWCHISAPCRDLIARLLAKDPDDRISAAEACDHPWIAGDDPPEPTEAQLKELTEFGPAPREDICFWRPEEVPEYTKQNSFVIDSKVLEELLNGV